jgi:hypothetical protein
VVSALATAPKGCGFEPGKSDGFLRAIKFRSTHSSRMRSKAGRSHKIIISSPISYSLQRSLVVKLGLADVARSLGHIRFHPGIV